MKRLRLAVCTVLLLAVLTSCSNVKQTVFEMELTENYSNSDPFIHAKLFCVPEDIEKLKLEFSFQMEGKSGLLEIADNNTDEVLWSQAWDGDAPSSDFTVSLENVKEEKEYVVRFTGYEIKYAKIVLSSDNSLIKERERPLKSK